MANSFQSLTNATNSYLLDVSRVLPLTHKREFYYFSKRSGAFVKSFKLSYRHISMDHWNGSDQDQAPAVTVHGDFER